MTIIRSLSAAAAAIAFVLASAAGVGCSSETTTTSSSSQSLKCCVNGAYYDCKTEEQMKTCGTRTMTCPSDSSKNDQCK